MSADLIRVTKGSDGSLTWDGAPKWAGGSLAGAGLSQGRASPPPAPEGTPTLLQAAPV